MYNYKNDDNHHHHTACAPLLFFILVEFQDLESSNASWWR